MAFKTKTDAYAVRELELMMTQPSNNGSDEQPEVVLRIEDDASSALFVIIRMSAVEFTQLLGTRSVRVKAEVLRNLSRLGKRMETGSKFLPLLHGDGARGWSDAELAAEAEAWCVAEGFETVEWHRVGGSGGYRITGRRWVDPEEKQEEVQG